MSLYGRQNSFNYNVILGEQFLAIEKVFWSFSKMSCSFYKKSLSGRSKFAIRRDWKEPRVV